ncbi:hypothetical protein B0T26DRAFT_742122 [Lasiosphaeria miniovina]|uniref:FAD-binding PCMH-type domain-containing protein n=1 Tax=Lasiosphaeria miniovina TaxID=1954250 RepID=A0AA40ACM0_9PEZI|nr:uncharacterized protein B0T26DRAFT_742122 [Lasiosphaeria miniovina]KAK0713408.1 hypothetical protein B0T26DRAFT_742122 [Lasiosphaeria miniovina]
MDICVCISRSPKHITHHGPTNTDFAQCTRLSAALGAQVSFAGQAPYSQTSSSFWSLQEATLAPACVVRPTAAQHVATVVSIALSSGEGCRLAVKGQGHAPAAGFANMDGGVTVDMAGLNRVAVNHDASVAANHDASVASVAAGASWLDVYRYLEPFGMAVAGGRNGLVGVGGLTVGGGISHFSPRVGWACDNVVNFERASVFDAFSAIANATVFDIYASLVTGLLYNSTSQRWLISSSAVYTRPVLEPAIFAPLAAVPSIAQSSRLTSLAALADEAPNPQMYWFFATATFAPSAELMGDIFDALNATLYAFNPAGGVVWNIAFEPLPSVMLARAGKRGGNILGLGPADGNAFVVLLSAFWSRSSSTAAVAQTARRALAEIESCGRARNQLKRFQYLNYAGPFQDPISSYGADNVEFLRRVGDGYDPKGFFQSRVPGGFKIPQRVRG